ncbi:hypothetical protein BC835DRAFT_1311262 [Cytidiella melzeri]|nr:hypothetical protein BC835DRAFT_1311262 [Cytidiella melzeri]
MVDIDNYYTSSVSARLKSKAQKLKEYLTERTNKKTKERDRGNTKNKGPGSEPLTAQKWKTSEGVKKRKHNHVSTSIQCQHQCHESAWNKTLPPSPRLINEIDFPTPIVAAQRAAEEWKARTASQKERKAIADNREAKETAKSKASMSAEKALQTPLSATLHKPPQPVKNALTSGPELEGESKSSCQGVHAPSREDSIFSPVIKGANAGRAKHTQGRVDPPVHRDSATIPSQN